MGLFGVRRMASKDHPQENVLSPSKAGSALLANLFADDEEPEDKDSYKNNITNSRASNVSLNKSSKELDINHKRSTSISPTSRDARDNHSPLPGSNGSSNRTWDRSSRKGRQDNKETMSRLARRDSIKRSLSRKLARSESRRQMLNIKDERNNKLPTGDRHRQSKENSLNENAQHPKGKEQKSSQISMSPVTPATVSQLNQEDDGTQKEIHNRASSNEHIINKLSGVKLAALDELNADESVAPMSESGSSLALTLEAATFAMPHADNGVPSTSSVNSNPSSKPRTRRRPPPLVGTQGKATNSTADWPSGGVFGSDGGFITGGFRITAEGMVGRPDLQTRQDSDPEADEEAPKSVEAVVTVRALKEFRNGPTIGAGAAGRVYIAEHLPSETTMALKVVNVYNKEKRNQLLKELETLCTHISRYLVRFHGAFYDGSGAVHIALEYMDHGCLSTFVQRVGAIPERIVQMIAQDCLRGLRFLHRHHVLHRDFKTANILLSRKLCRTKLSDFGLARDLHPGVSKVDTFVGTVAYMSPERLQGGRYTYASDVWALGVSLVECLIGRHPFNRPQNYFDFIEATAASGNLQGFDKDQKFSDEARDFITQCTYTDPTKRPHAVELLEHSWIKGMRRDPEEFGSWLDEARTISMQVSSHQGK